MPLSGDEAAARDHPGTFPSVLQGRNDHRGGRGLQQRGPELLRGVPQERPCRTHGAERRVLAPGLQRRVQDQHREEGKRLFEGRVLSPTFSVWGPHFRDNCRGLNNGLHWLNALVGSGLLQRFVNQPTRASSVLITVLKKKR